MNPAPGHLSFADIEILQAVYDAGRITIDELSEKLPTQQALLTRVNTLCEPDASPYSPLVAIPNSSYLRRVKENHTQIELTPIGLQALEDRWTIDKKASRQRLEDRIWKFGPMVLSVIALLKSFWPEFTWLWRQLVQLLTK